MKLLALTVAILLSASTWATAEKVSLGSDKLSMSMDDLEKEMDRVPRTTVETGLAMSMIDPASTFVTVGLLRHAYGDFSVGLRGLMRTGLNELILAQLLARYTLTADAVSSLYLQAEGTEAYFTNPGSTTRFNMAGLSVGYSRELRGGFSWGGALGFDVSDTRISSDVAKTGQAAIYNKIALNGAYEF